MSIAHGCSTTSSSEGKPILRTEFVRGQVPSEARKPCDPPVTLPDRALSAKELTPLWGKDRAALAVCEQRRGAAIAAIDTVPVPAERPK
ncbi:hypothetical protein F9L00_25020 [Brucella anthropi]|nr:MULTISPECIES: hypothetical protein [Brucella/Ochrobactrum group]KAB2772904.1 hypothetical protein F9L00_25020 [Brucella anthropi]MCQ9148391.1 hypothetical protein [Ochrobactrum sp. BTU2]NVM42036.1 hypothetical protein [Brucella intermedia]